MAPVMKVFTVGLDEKTPAKEQISESPQMPPPPPPIITVEKKRSSYKGYMMCITSLFFIILLAIIISEVAYNRMRDETFLRLKWAELKQRMGYGPRCDECYNRMHPPIFIKEPPVIEGQHRKLNFNPSVIETTATSTPEPQDVGLNFLREVLSKIREQAEKEGFDGTMQVSVIKLGPSENNQDMESFLDGFGEIQKPHSFQTTLDKLQNSGESEDNFIMNKPQQPDFTIGQPNNFWPPPPFVLSSFDPTMTNYMNNMDTMDKNFQWSPEMRMPFPHNHMMMRPPPPPMAFPVMPPMFSFPHQLEFGNDIMTDMRNFQGPPMHPPPPPPPSMPNNFIGWSSFMNSKPMNLEFNKPEMPPFSQNMEFVDQFNQNSIQNKDNFFRLPLQQITPESPISAKQPVQQQQPPKENPETNAETPNLIPFEPLNAKFDFNNVPGPVVPIASIQESFNQAPVIPDQAPVIPDQAPVIPDQAPIIPKLPIEPVENPDTPPADFDKPEAGFDAHIKPVETQNDVVIDELEQHPDQSSIFFQMDRPADIEGDN